MTDRSDPRLAPPSWDASGGGRRTGERVRWLLALTLPLAVFYFAWLLQPVRIGDPLLYGLLVAAELFNVAQAVGFWWTCSNERLRQPRRWRGADPAVDVLVPVYGEPVEVVEPAIAAAAALRGAQVRVWLCDDGDDDAMAAVAARHGACYLRRDEHGGAKAGNLNHALARARAPFVLVLDCDHVADPRLLEATLGHLEDPRVAFVQTPQYYANHRRGGVTAAAWAQQALFFGVIARGKDGLGAMFCCGTNVVFRRAALDAIGGFPEGSLTEDFLLSIELHARGWRTAYLPQVLASGLGPEDMASYVSQQQRWARGCLGGIVVALRARLPWRLRAQYLLSSAFFLSGWTLLVYMALPVVRILTGAQPLAGASADQFLLHFAPYFGFALLMVATAGGGSYTFSAFALGATNFWIHVTATVSAVLRRGGQFVVTPKRGTGARQPLAVAPALLLVALLVAVAFKGLVADHTPATLNNVAFAALHVCVLLSGAWPALVGHAPPARERRMRDSPARERQEHA